MIRVQLEACGDAVTRGLIPAYATPPEVIFWGSRVFRLLRRPDSHLEVTAEGAVRYEEVFAAALVPPFDLLERFPETPEELEALVLSRKAEAAQREREAAPKPVSSS